MKQIRIEVNKHFGTAGLIAGLPAHHGSTWHANEFIALLVIALVTRPAITTGLSLSDYWAWLRYNRAISRRSAGLRLTRDWSELDAHQKTILSDDFGVGFPVLYLMEKFHLDDFVETSAFLRTHPGVATLGGKLKKVGPKKKPDYMALDGSGGIHVLECKGTQTSRHKLHQAMKSGIGQKANISLTAGAAFASQMVAGIYVPQHAHKKSAVMEFLDPDWAGLAAIVNSLEPEQRIMTMQRLSLAKQINLLGLVNTSRAIAIPGTPPITSGESDLERRRVLDGKGDLFQEDVSGTWPENLGGPIGRERLPRSYRFLMSYPRETLEVLVETSRRSPTERSNTLEGLFDLGDWITRTPETEQVDEERQSTATLTTRSGFTLRLEVEWPAS